MTTSPPPQLTASSTEPPTTQNPQHNHPDHHIQLNEKFERVTTEEGCKALAKHLQRHPLVIFDCEYSRREERIAVLQFSTRKLGNEEGTDYVVNLAAAGEGSLQIFKNLLENRKIFWVLYAGLSDCTWMAQEGINFRFFFDCQLTLFYMFGFDAKCSLLDARVCYNKFENFSEETLARERKNKKRNQIGLDWYRKKLTKRQLDYARSDTAYLKTIFGYIEKHPAYDLGAKLSSVFRRLPDSKQKQKELNKTFEKYRKYNSATYKIEEMHPYDNDFPIESDDFDRIFNNTVKSGYNEKTVEIEWGTDDENEAVDIQELKFNGENDPWEVVDEGFDDDSLTIEKPNHTNTETQHKLTNTPTDKPKHKQEKPISDNHAKKTSIKKEVQGLHWKFEGMGSWEDNEEESEEEKNLKNLNEARSKSFEMGNRVITAKKDWTPKHQDLPPIDLPCLLKTTAYTPKQLKDTNDWFNWDGKGLLPTPTNPDLKMPILDFNGEFTLKIKISHRAIIRQLKAGLRLEEYLIKTITNQPSGVLYKRVVKAQWLRQELRSYFKQERLMCLKRMGKLKVGGVLVSKNFEFYDDEEDEEGVWTRSRPKEAGGDSGIDTEEEDYGETFDIEEFEKLRG